MQGHLFDSRPFDQTIGRVAIKATHDPQGLTPKRQINHQKPGQNELNDDNEAQSRAQLGRLHNCARKSQAAL